MEVLLFCTLLFPQSFLLGLCSSVSWHSLRDSLWALCSSAPWHYLRASVMGLYSSVLKDFLRASFMFSSSYIITDKLCTMDLQLPVQSVPITTNVVSLNPAHGEMYSIQHYVIKFFSDLRQVDGFLWVLRFPPPIKLTAKI